MPMLATPRLYAFHQRSPDSRWWSLGISAVLTAALFAASFVAMKSVAPWMENATPAAPPVILRFTPPATVAPKPARRLPLATRSPGARPIPVPVPPSVQSPATATPTELAPPVDTANVSGAPHPTNAPAAASKAPDTGASPASSGIAAPHAAPASHAGAPVAPAGVVGKRAPKMTSDMRANSLKTSMNSLAEYVRTHPPTGDELANIQREKRQAEQVERRMTTAGNSRDVHVVTGEGKDGVGVPGGGLSYGTHAAGHIAMPFLEPGPSAAQRKRDEAIDSEYRARLGRLEARAAAMRAAASAARVDSLRRDSLARKSGVPRGAPLDRE